MIHVSDNVVLTVESIRAHKLRAALTVLGLVMGVTTSPFFRVGEFCHAPLV